MLAIMESLNVIVIVAVVFTLAAPPAGATEATDVLGAGAVELMHEDRVSTPAIKAAPAKRNRDDR